MNKLIIVIFMSFLTLFSKAQVNTVSQDKNISIKISVIKKGNDVFLISEITNNYSSPVVLAGLALRDDSGNFIESSSSYLKTYIYDENKNKIKESGKFYFTRDLGGRRNKLLQSGESYKLPALLFPKQSSSSRALYESFIPNVKYISVNFKFIYSTATEVRVMNNCTPLIPL